MEAGNRCIRPDVPEETTPGAWFDHVSDLNLVYRARPRNLLAKGCIRADPLTGNECGQVSRNYRPADRRSRPSTDST